MLSGERFVNQVALGHLSVPFVSDNRTVRQGMKRDERIDRIAGKRFERLPFVTVEGRLWGRNGRDEMSHCLETINEGRVLVNIGQVTEDDQRELNRMVRKGTVTKWRGYWHPIPGASWGFGPLKACYALTSAVTP